MKTTIHNGRRICVTAETRHNMKMYYQKIDDIENVDEIGGETTDEWLARMHAAKRGPDVGDVERFACEW